MATSSVWACLNHTKRACLTSVFSLGVAGGQYFFLIHTDNMLSGNPKHSATRVDLLDLLSKMHNNTYDLS